MKQETILVVQREKLSAYIDEQGLSNAHTQTILALINQEHEFKSRPAMEEDCSYKQIIPYMIFKHADRYFLMQRSATSTDQRLKNMYSLGIGGHMRQEDMHNGATIFDWGSREFHEEIEYSGNLSMSTMGIINDDSTSVGKVHLGLVILLEGNSPNIIIRSELKSGQLLTAHEILDFYPHMESWSKIIFDKLLQTSPSHSAHQKQIMP